MNQKAFNIFLDSHQESLYRMIRSRVGSDQDAEDILQEVLLKIYQNHDRFQGQAKLNTWFYTICKNSIADYYRKPWWKFLWIFKETEQQDQNNPELLLLACEQQNEILALLRTLPRQEQEIFRLRFFDHFSLEEIALCQGISLSTAKTHLYRATKKMRTELRQRGDTP
jgi:RNA polymerase sigma-70 factor (ECF subfamily)